MTRYKVSTWKGTVLLFTGMLISFFTSAYRWCKSGCAQLAVKGLLGGGRPLISGFYWKLLEFLAILWNGLRGRETFSDFVFLSLVSWETFAFHLTWICRCLTFKVLIKRLFNGINIPHNDLTLVMQSIAAFRIVVWLSSYCCFTGETEWRVQGNSTSN